jgi:glycosyltransferase involved in cell wall biosynthesis
MRVLLVGEGDLSHGALLQRLRSGLQAHDGVEVAVAAVPDPTGPEAQLVRRLPRLGELDLQPLRWRLRYSWRARRLLQARAAHADVVFVNTQACALLARGPMRRTPTVLSVDATGRQFAALEYWRPRSRGARIAEAPNEALERRAYAHARAIVAWTDWTAASLRADYGVPAARIHVLHFGVELPPAPADAGDGPLRVLFVGNAVERKGLDALVRARALAHAPVELDVVSGDRVEAGAGVRVHRGVTPGSPALAQLYRSAGAFALPTRADGAPWVVVEAMAAGLPVVATPVGAIPELVGEAGLLVPAGDVRALAAALDRLAAEPGLRRELAARARARAAERYDEARQLPRLVEVLREAATVSPT